MKKLIVTLLLTACLSMTVLAGDIPGNLVGDIPGNGPTPPPPGAQASPIVDLLVNIIGLVF